MKQRIGFIAIFMICWLTAVVSAETVWIDPPEMTSPEVGQTFTLELRISAAKGLFGFEFDLSYNPEFLKFVGATEGDFLQKAGQTFAVSPIVFGEKPKDGGTGTIRMGVSRLGGSGVDGNGVLAQVEFEVQKAVSTPLLLEFKKISLFDAQAKKKAPEKMVGAKITPSQNLTPWDVNKDGIVNVFDFVIVGSQFGQSGVGLSGDVNGDGVVNVFDLVSVGSHFGESTVAASPSLHGEPNGTMPNTEQLRRALAELEAIPNPSQGAEIARRFLQAWLMKVPEPIVTETKLLSNYPNPFNPETWIPYQLARDAEVQVTIYDLKGSVVRRLELGHQRAGYYTERDKAVYWDGRNEAGEWVASGVYLYQLVTPSFQQTRRMVVVK